MVTSRKGRVSPDELKLKLMIQHDISEATRLLLHGIASSNCMAGMLLNYPGEPQDMVEPLRTQLSTGVERIRDALGVLKTVEIRLGIYKKMLRKPKNTPKRKR